MTLRPTLPCVILLVEDEIADAYLVRTAFQENRFLADLRHVTDGVEALAYLRGEGRYGEDAPRPDLILLDLNMPRMDGREFLATVKADADLRSIPVVVLTTSDVERDVTASYDNGASGYIVKPVDIEQLIQAVKQLNDYWFTLIRLPRIS